MPNSTPAEVITAHTLIRYDRNAWWCECGADYRTVEDSHALHVLDALKAARYAVVPVIDLHRLRGELTAARLLLEATQEQHAKTIADFCALRDALPREQVKQILGVDDA